MRLNLSRLRARRFHASFVRAAAVIAAALSLFFCGCSNHSEDADSKEPHWHTYLHDAMTECKKSGKPLLIISIAGDLKEQC